MLSILGPYKNLILQSTLSLFITLIVTLLKLPIRFLEGLHTYIHPENLGNDKTNPGVRAAIRRPETAELPASGLDGYRNLSSNAEPRKKNRSSKEKFEFDENNAQIFRLLLVDSHIQSRVYYTEYRDAFVYSTVAISSLLLQNFLVVSNGSGVWVNGSVVPLVLGFIAVCKVSFFIAKASFERSASRRLEKQLSVFLGGLGFVLAVFVVFLISPVVFDFQFDGIDGFGKFSLAVFAGFFTGFLFVPATKNAGSFWLGTDQLRWNLSIISCGWIARTLLYVNYIVVAFTALLWINPVADILVIKRNLSSNGVNWRGRIAVNVNLVGKIGMDQSEFCKFRNCCLLASGISQILTLRPNLQMYLNEAVLSWYQRLHASKVPDLDFSRAKIFLHNYYLCLVVLQFFASSALVVSFLGLSQIEGNLLKTFQVVCNILPCSAFVKDGALFMAWWVVFVWSIFTSLSLVLYRCGVLYIS